MRKKGNEYASLTQSDIEARKARNGSFLRFCFCLFLANKNARKVV